jgi:hypothetical protein
MITLADPDPDPWTRNLDQGSGMEEKSGSGSGIHDEHKGSYFRQLRNYFF